MSLNNVLVIAADKTLESIGFIKTKKFRNYYVYINKDGNRIEFDVSSHFKGVRVFYNAYTLNDIFNISDLPSNLANFYRNPVNMGFFPYNDDKELAIIITQLLKLTIERIIPIYNALERPRPDLPSKELRKKLSENVVLFAEKFMQEYNFSYVNDVPSIKKVILDLQRLLDQKRSDCSDEPEELFLCAAAYYGELINKAHGSCWTWNEDILLISKKSNIIIIENASISPLGAIKDYWIMPELYFYSIMESYKKFLHHLLIEKYYD